MKYRDGDGRLNGFHFPRNPLASAVACQPYRTFSMRLAVRIVGRPFVLSTISKNELRSRIELVRRLADDPAGGDESGRGALGRTV